MLRKLSHQPRLWKRKGNERTGSARDQLRFAYSRPYLCTGNCYFIEKKIIVNASMTIYL